MFLGESSAYLSQELLPAQVDEYGRPLAPGGGSTAAAAAPELRIPAGEEWEVLQARHPRWSSLLITHGIHVTKTVTQASGGVIANELMGKAAPDVQLTASHFSSTPSYDRAAGCFMVARRDQHACDISRSGTFADSHPQAAWRPPTQIRQDDCMPGNQS